MKLAKPEKLLLKLGLLAAFAALFALWYFLDLPCRPRAITGIPCPGCGMTRAWLAALQLDFGTAFRQYPMFWSIPLLALFALYDGKLFAHRKINDLILGILLAGILLIYLARLFGFLGILLPL